LSALEGRIILEVRRRDLCFARTLRMSTNLETINLSESTTRNKKLLGTESIDGVLSEFEPM
jgi:hypothetical protein